MSKNDNRIKKLMEKVEKQQAELGEKPKFRPITNARYPYEGKHINLNVVNDPDVIIKLTGWLILQEEVSKKASEILEIEPTTIKIDGYTPKEWISDFKRCMEILKWKDKEACLNITKSKLNSLLSEEGKTADMLDDIEKMLG